MTFVIKAAFALCLLSGAVAAAADEPANMDEAIIAYNDAVTRGTPADKAEAARQLSSAVLANPDRDDAALLAYETGSTLCLYAECNDTAAMIEFASGRQLPPGGITQDDVALLAAYADWTRDKTRDSRARLDEALDAKEDADLSYLSLAAFHNRFAEDVSDRDWDRAARTAAQAARHFEPFRSVVGQQWSDARIVSITSAFNHKPDTEQVIDIVTHKNTMKEMMREIGSNYPDWLYDQYYLSDAWQMAMEAYFQYDGNRTGSRLSNIEQDQLRRKLDEIEQQTADVRVEMAADTAPASNPSLPFCKGQFDMRPRLQYPTSAANKGMFGALIVKFSVEDLKVAETEVLAAVPQGVFEENALSALREWQWDVKDGRPGETCRTSQSNLIIPFVFQIQ